MCSILKEEKTQVSSNNPLARGNTLKIIVNNDDSINSDSETFWEFIGQDGKDFTFSTTTNGKNNDDNVLESGTDYITILLSPYSTYVVKAFQGNCWTNSITVIGKMM